jgi:hypothetical protein
MALGRDLTPAGWDCFLEAMPVALREVDMGWLAETMNDRRLWNRERTQTRNGHPYTLTINVPDAAMMLDYTEFSTGYTMAVAGASLLHRASPPARCIGRAMRLNRAPHAGTWRVRGSAAVQSWRGIGGTRIPAAEVVIPAGLSVITRDGYGSG